MSADRQPRRTSAAIRGFKIWFGGIFLAIGLLALLAGIAAWLLMPAATPLGDAKYAVILPPLGLGIAFSLLGGTFMGLGLAKLRRDARLAQFGTTTDATVVAVEPTSTRVNHRVLWHVVYAYRDMVGAEHRGDSGYLDREEATSYREGDSVLVRYDPASPATSAWIGRDEMAGPA